MRSGDNRFKQALAAGRSQIGLWCTLSTGFTAEVVAGAGFDWLLLDTEHSPGDVLTVLAQLQALSGYPVAPVVRPASNDPVLIKRLLDCGAQSLLIPYVETVADARAAVAAIRYPPSGMRGVSAITRATQFGRVRNYARDAEAGLCLIVQIETRRGVDALEEIAAVDGIDGVFVGPSDLAASLGHIGDPGHPDVVAVVEDAVARIVACGKPAGILTADPVFAERCIALGTIFTAVGVDAALLARAADALAMWFRPPTGTSHGGG